MKKRSITIIVALLVIMSMAFFSGCGQPATDDTGPTAEENVQSALDAMNNGDFDSALSYFSTAAAQDSTNETAVMGYALLNIVSLSVDPGVVSMAKNNLGMMDYPSKMSSILDPSSWMINSYLWSYDSDYDGIDDTDVFGLFPGITGESDENSDGTIDYGERMNAFLNYLFGNNTGFDFVPETLDTVLGTRLDDAIAAIKDYVTDDMEFTLTWNMFVSDAVDWPFTDVNGDPIDIVLGKPELLSFAVDLEHMAAYVNLMQVYSLALPMSEIYNLINQGTSLSTNPLDTFLTLNSDASTRLAAAKGYFKSAVADQKAVSEGILSDRPGYTLSSTSPLFSADPATWTSVTDNMKINSKISDEANNSLNNNTLMYIPLDFTDFLGSGAWPTSFDADLDGDGYYDEIGINLGTLLSSPIQLFGASGDTSALIVFASDDDPEVFVDDGLGGYRTLAISDFPYDGTYYDFATGPMNFYLKVRYTPTLNNIYPVENFGFTLPAEYQDPYYYMQNYMVDSEFAWMTVASEGEQAQDDVSMSFITYTSYGTFWNSYF